jgi:antitoxin (DNA-binding transcriptional repressor) of toxin-antitoxin stability system
MFGRFRNTNDPARENDGGAVAVSERDEPATSVVTPSADPAVREQRLEELRATQADDADTRGLDRERVVETDRTAESDRFARTEHAPVEERTSVAERAPVADRDLDDEPRTIPAVVAEDTVVAMRARQRDRFGGIRWGSAFFGLLSAVGLAALLLGIVAAAGVTLGVSEINNVRSGNTDTIGLGGAILVLAALALSWYCGGYVAGRMARFDGARQGIGVWVWTLVIGAALAVAAVIGGSQYDVLQQLNLPNVAVGDQSLTTTGLITLAAALVVTLLFAVLGGKAGELYHRRVDRFAARDYVETA